MGLTALAGAYVDRLSGGERKKAFFAMTLAQDTPVVLLDEPTAHLDVVSRFDFMDLLDRLKDQTGKTFLVVMHELPEVLRCAGGIVALMTGGWFFRVTRRPAWPRRSPSGFSAWPSPADGTGATR